MITTALGALGAVLVLLAFAINHRKIRKRLTYEYTLLTLAGSLLLAVYAFSLNSVVMFILNAFWFLVAFHFIMKLSHHKRRGRGT